MKKKPQDYNSRAAAAIAAENTVAQVQKPFGNEGELVVRLWDTFPETTTEPLWVEIDSLAVPLFIRSFTPQGVSKAVIVFDDFQDSQSAALLIGHKLYSEHVAQEQEQSDDWSFLIGFTFEETTSQRKGVITGYLDSPLNPLLEVESESEEYLIPISESLIEKINERRSHIVLRLAEGIFSL